MKAVRPVHFAVLAMHVLLVAHCYMSLVVFAGKCIPITRGAGIYQPRMGEVLDRINEGDWVNFVSIPSLLFT